MKTKRLILSALLLLSLGLTACNNQPSQPTGSDSSNTPSQSSNNDASDSSGDSTPQGHVHSFARAWRTSETHHWHACTGTADDGQPCQEKDSYGEHTFDNGEIVTPAGATTPGKKKFTCTVCKYGYVEDIPAVGGQDAYQEGTEGNVPVYNFHTELQRQYLADDWTTNKTYIPSVNAEDGRQHDDLSVPTAITLNCSDVENASKYYIQLSENSNFSNAKLYESTTKFYNVYNTKIGTQYYYRAATSQAGLSSAIAKTFKVSAQAPRNLKVDGVLNFRDVGGWASSLVPNARVKQGMYYSCGHFNSISAAGKETVKELGI